MGKEIVNQVQEAQWIPGSINPRRNTPRHTVIKLTKIKDTEKILKATREKWQHTRELPSGYQLISQQKLYKPEGMKWYIKSDEREELTTKNTLPRKTLIQIWWRNQKLSRQAKVKRIQHHQTSFTTNAKGTSLGRRHREGKDLQKINPKQFRKQ